jgi:hypothetical protein
MAGDSVNPTDSYVMNGGNQGDEVVGVEVVYSVFPSLPLVTLWEWMVVAYTL